MFCTECGTRIEDDAVFCPNCGAKIAQAAAEAPKAEAAKAEAAKAEAAKAEAPKAEAIAPQPVASTPKPEAPKPAAPAPQPVASTPKAEAPKPAAPAPQPEEPPKKSHALLIAGLCLAVFLLLLIIVCGIALKKYWNGIDEKKEKTEVSRIYDEEPALPIDEPVQVLPSESEATPEPTAEPTATPEPTVAPTATPEPSMSPEEAFSKQEEKLIAESSRIQIATAYRAPYVSVDEWYGPASQFDRNVKGVIKTLLRDFDGDGAEEMLVIRVNEGSLEYEVYEFDGKEVRLGTSYNTLRKNQDMALFDKNDQMNLNVYLYSHDGRQFLVERFDACRDWETDYDGKYLGILFYGNGSLISLYSNYCTGMDEQSFEISEEDALLLLELGLTNTAANYRLVGDPLSMEDGLEEILFVVATRSEEQILRDQETYDPEAGNVSELGGVSYYFFNKESECDKDDELLSADWLPLGGDYLDGYSVHRNDHSIASTEELGGIINYCDHVKFKTYAEEQGDGTLADWLNEQVENAVSGYDGDAVLKSLKEEYEGKAESPYPDEVYSFRPLECTVVYAEGTYVSVGFEWDWYMGGVHNAGGFGLNCNLEEKREITLEELLGKEADEVRSMVAQGISDAIEMEDNEVFQTKIDQFLEENGKYSFWFDQDTVYVMFESYSLDMGGGAILVKLER